MSKSTKQRARERAQSRQKQQPRLIYGGALLMILVVGGIIAYTLLDTPPEVPEARLGQEAILGNPDGQVQIVEYGAYGCASCRDLHQSGLFDQLIDLYGDEVGFTFRNWPNIVPTIDPIAAEAAQCALDQGDEAFWTMHDALFTISLSEYRAMSDTEAYAQMAEAHDLDGAALGECLQEDAHQRTIQHWEDEGEDRNIRGTPTIYVNGQLTSAGSLRQTVENALGG